MELYIKSPRQALDLAYRKQTVTRDEIDLFKQQFRQLLDRLNPNQSEENAKSHLATFLKATYYGNDFLIATKDRTDLVIHSGSKSTSSAAVLLETKRPKTDGQAASDMLRPDKPNVKAIHELLLYFFRERIEAQNTDLKYLIATDVYTFFVFEAADFERLFFNNRSLRKDYELWRDGRKTGQTTDFFYQHIAQPFLEQLNEPLPCVYFDLRTFIPYALNDDPSDDYKLLPLFKFLAPTQLLRLPFTNDSNSLNKDFYFELLHLIGLEESKEGNKKIIQRKPPQQRQAGSLLENTLRTLQTEERLTKVSKRSSYGQTPEQQLFGVGLELCITWVNRVLFLKLLEAQLLQYQENDASYRFLHSRILPDYDELNELFFEVLAKENSERTAFNQTRYSKVPYLNSSLFEITDLESETLRINSLKDRFELPLYARTVLKDKKGKRLVGAMPVLAYLLAFLEAYNFSSEGTESIQEDNKSLINASVLGLIFEKINGYQDGAFFTPGFITMYMCRESLRRATVQKFRNSNYFADFDSEHFTDLSNYLSRKYNTQDLVAANQLVNSLKICDPAVGSGHFLVSALNELLAIKSELGILCNQQGKPLPVRVEVANDELNVQWRHNDQLFAYRPGVQDSQEVQQSLFHEKQSLIENCLFGVDLNPNSVKICRLRLWIELLKNAYYIQPDKAAPSAKSLQTLPNIDINIKQGNSLVSRFDLQEDLRAALKKNKWSIESYKMAVATYHATTDKAVKREMEAFINRIKQDFSTEIRMSNPLVKRLDKLASELYHRFTGNFLFEPESYYGKDDKEKQQLQKKSEQERGKLEKEIDQLNEKIQAVKNNKIFEQAFEWRFEFPEVLNDEGGFIGFDVVVGNPPYIRQEEFSALKPYLKERFETFSGTADLLVYFIERAYQILKTDGHFSFIISNKFMRAGFGKPLREWLAQRRLLEIIDFGDLPVFDEATTYPCILSWQKATPQEQFLAANVPALHTATFQQDLADIRFPSLQTALAPEGWTLADAATQQLLDKLKSSGIPLGEYVEGKIYRGVLTGLNEAFVIDADTKAQLIAQDPRSAEVIKPFLAGRDVKRYQQPKADKFLLLFPKGWTIEKLGKVSEQVAFSYLKAQFPALANHLAPFATKAHKRTDQGDYWWELRACDYYPEFEKEKITWPETSLDNQITILPKGVHLNKTTFFIPVLDYFLLGVLNSKVIRFYLDQIVSKMRGGYFMLSKIYMETVPVIAEKPGNIAEKAKAILDLKQNDPHSDTTQLEAEIDQLVYTLYGLTAEEIALVEEA